MRGPDAVALVLTPRPCKEVEPAAVFFVEPIHGALGLGNGGRVRVRMLTPGFHQVAQQGKAQVFPTVARGKAEGFKPARKLFPILRRGEHRRHRQHCARTLRHSLHQFHARQEPRRKFAQQDGVYGVLYEFRGRQQRQERRPDAARDIPQRNAQRRRQHSHRQGIERAGRSVPRSAQGLYKYPPTHVGAALIALVCAREFEGFLGAVELAHALAPGQARVAPPIERAAALVHVRIRSGRVELKSARHQIRALDEPGHVCRCKMPQRAYGSRDYPLARRAGESFAGYDLHKPRLDGGREQFQFPHGQRRHALIALKVRRGLVLIHVPTQPGNQLSRRLAYQGVAPARTQLLAHGEVHGRAARLALY